MKSYSKPTSEQIDNALSVLSLQQHWAYFFSRLNNPLWIAELAERDIFKYPPKAEPVEGGGLRFPRWHQGEYLVRMAVHAPAEVAAIFAKIETDNALILGDIVKVALEMPPKIAADLIPTISKAARQGKLWIFCKDAGDLCIRLAEGGEHEAGLELADALYTPTFGEDEDAPNGRDVYWYRDGLAKAVPVFSTVAPHGFLRRLCVWLETCVAAKEHVDAESGNDASTNWRPAIEEHEQNNEYDFAGVMVGLVREGLEIGIREKCISFDEALGLVERHSYLIFKRLRLHLIAEFASQVPEMARESILCRELFDSYKYKHEYARLVSKRLDLLFPEQRKSWFGWVDAGPKWTRFDQSIEEFEGRKPTETERQQRSDYWKFEKLHLVRQHLEGERLQFYEKMLAEHGEPEMADLNVRRSKVGRGEESPMTVENLAAKAFDDAVETVSSWRPDDSTSRGPSVEGLGSTFEDYVATNPERFSTKARSLIDRPANFVRGFISRMAKAVEAGREIDLFAVLDLCDWVMQRPIDERTTPRGRRDLLVDNDWEWTRSEIARFLQSVCKSDLTVAPEHSWGEVRKRLWDLIEPLCRERAKSYMVYNSSEEDPRVQDYLDRGINSLRGKAVEAALEYAKLVMKHFERDAHESDFGQVGFDAMPEFHEMLEWQISPENRSFEALAIIGSGIGLIYSIDRKWLGGNADRIFQLEEIEQNPSAAHGWAAWNAFLVWVMPHVELFQLFKSQFSYAVEQAEKVQTIEHSPQQPMHRLGEHLMVLYGRGDVGFDDDGRILRRFLDNANSDIRRHAIGFVGLSLERSGEVPEEIIERFQTLWDHYWSGMGEKDAAESPKAWLFGTWFECGKFPAKWALDRLYRFVEVNPTPEPDHSIARKLLEIADEDIDLSIRIVDRMIRGDNEGWRIAGWKKEASDILKMALRAGDESREIARKLIDYLGRRGHIEFGELLPLH